MESCRHILPGVEDLGEDVGSPDGIKFLGTAIGSLEFVHSFVERRLEDEGRLWEAVMWVPDLQSAWQILLHCAGPRCHHLLRTLLPSQSTSGKHCQCVSEASGSGVQHGWRPERSGRHGPTPLPMIHERLAQVARNVVDRLDGVQETDGCTRELHDVTVELDRQGFVGRPTWVFGIAANVTEPGERVSWMLHKTRVYS